MSKDFVLIQGHGIYPTDTVKKVVPDVNESFEIEVFPPQTSLEHFSFRFIKSTEISLQINLLVDKKEETLVDARHIHVLREHYDMAQDEFLKLLFGTNVSTTVEKAISHYKRRLTKTEEYLQKVNIVQANPTAPDYQANLAALAKDQPSVDTAVKQNESIEKIRNRSQKRLEEIIAEEEENQENEEFTQHAIIAMFETDQHREDISRRTNNLLGRFYSLSFGGYFEDEDEDIERLGNDNSGFDLSEDRIQQDIETAFEVSQSTDTLRNNSDVVSIMPEDEEEGASPAASPDSEDA